MSKIYPDKLLTMIDNMIKLHINYDEIYEQVKISFPELNITYDELCDEIIVDRVIKML